jgi:hypothetical protein
MVVGCGGVYPIGVGLNPHLWGSIVDNSQSFQRFIHRPPPQRIHILKPMQFHEFYVFRFECSFLMVLFLVADITIYIFNPGMRNPVNTKTPLPNEFFRNQIVAINKIS